MYKTTTINYFTNSQQFIKHALIFITLYVIYSHLSRYPGVPDGIQEENGIKYKFEVYEKNI